MKRKYYDAPSILQDERKCFVSGCTENLEKHHIFEAANRRHSAELGLWVYLRHDLHNEPPYGVHHNAKEGYKLKQIAQRKFEETHTREEFVSTFGRSWL